MATDGMAECLRELLQAAAHMECEAYRHWALARIGVLIPFDEAQWHIVELHDLDHWVTYREPVEAGRQPVRIRFTRQPDSRFEAEERSLLLLLASQACSAWRVAAYLGLLRQLCPSREAAALADREGHIHAVHGHFYTLLRASWPDWQGGPLPLPLCAPGPSSAALVVGAHRWNVSRHGELLRITVQSLGAAARLTTREQEIAAAVLDTGSQMAAAALLQVSPHTVRNTLVRVYSKLGVRNRTEMAMQYRSGLMCLPTA